MLDWTESLQWYFPGGAWGLALVIVILAVLIIISYVHTLRKLSFKRKIVLLSFRVAFSILLLLCLANPAKVRQKRMEARDEKQKIAVIIDESSSMTRNGFWNNKSRMQDAIAYWNKNLADKRDKFDFSLFTFSENLRPVKEFAVPDDSDGKVRGTDLFPMITDWIPRFDAENYDGVICMTDGMDTSPMTINEVMSALENSTIPHVFVPITLPVPSSPYINIQRIEAPTTASVGTEVPASMLLRISGVDESAKISVRIKRENDVVFQKDIVHDTSYTVDELLKFDLPLPTVQTHMFQAVVTLNGKDAASAKWSVHGLEKETLRVLLWQGGLDWGTHFLKDVFDRDEHAKLDLLFAPNSFGNERILKEINSTSPFTGKISDYDLVIILKAKRSQIDARMENDLREFLLHGGSVLFLVANTHDAVEYAGSPLEKLLPVVFVDNLSTAAVEDVKTRMFIEKMEQYRTPKNIAWSKENVELDTLDLPALKDFALTIDGQNSPIFKFLTLPGADKSYMPKLQDCALIQQIKPGAIVLAVHPDLEANHEPRILMATQRFGEGRTAVLATDPLWRWGLSLPSDNPAFDSFWQNLVAWLGAGHRQNPYWALSSAIIQPSIPTEIEFRIPSGSLELFKSLSFYCMDGDRKDLLTMTPTGSGGNYKTTYIAAPDRSLRLVAQTDKETIAQTFISSAPDAKEKELKILKPAVDALRQLASVYNVELAAEDDPFNFSEWLTHDKEEPPVISEQKPLWHNFWIYLAILGLYATELVARRSASLV